MISGAANANAAFLVIDAKQGVQEQSKRHAYMLSLLGIKNVSALVNKMDLVGYDQSVFDRIVADIKKFLNPLVVEPKKYIPVSGMLGDNIGSSAIVSNPRGAESRREYVWSTSFLISAASSSLERTIEHRMFPIGFERRYFGWGARL